MLKQLPSFFLVIFVISLFFAKSIYAAEEVNFGDNEFSEKYEVYKNNLETYSKLHEKYVIAKNQYFQYKTLTSKNNAQLATSEMIKSRIKVLVSYLQVLKARIEEAEGLPQEKKNESIALLEEDIIWFQENVRQVSSNMSLPDLQNNSDLEKARYDQLKRRVYPILYSISVGKIEYYRNRLSANLSTIQNKVDVIKKEEREEFKISQGRIENIDRWINEANLKIAESVSQQESVEKIYASNLSEARFYSFVLTKLDVVRGSLLKGTSYLVEILRLIKYQE